MKHAKIDKITETVAAAGTAADHYFAAGCLGRSETGFTDKKVTELYIADLHIHSRYSRATSKDCTPEHLDLWARRKGIHIVGTGDFTHPAWRQELEEKLEPAGEGMYVLKDEYRIRDGHVPGESIRVLLLPGRSVQFIRKMIR